MNNGYLMLVLGKPRASGYSLVGLDPPQWLKNSFFELKKGGGAFIGQKVPIVAYDKYDMIICNTQRLTVIILTE